MKLPRVHPVIVVATVTGLCLIAKVWVIRHLLGLQIEATEVIIPVILPGIHSALFALAHKRTSAPKFRWDHPGYWSVLVVVVTALSVIPFLG